MPDGSVTEAAKPAPEQLGSSSKAGRLPDWLKNFGRRAKTPPPKNTPEPALGQPKIIDKPLDKPVESELKPRNPTLQDELNTSFAERHVPPPPEFESQGASGFFGTNERLNPAMMESIRNSEHRPNGYIVGAGVSSMIACFEMFKTETDPKGLVFINIDPDAVADIQVFIEGLRNGEIIYRDGGGIEMKLSPGQYGGTDPYNNGENNIDTYNMLLKHSDRLIRLAKEGKIAIAKQDLLNKDVVEAVRGLDGFEQSKNVVYLSNIGDWIRREGAWGKDGIGNQEVKYMRTNPGQGGLSPEYRESHWRNMYAGFDNLKILDLSEPQVTYFVDTTDNAGYMLQVQTHVPNREKYFGRARAA